MKVVNLVAENFKILKAIDITPGEGPVVIGGDNEQGKSSVMDAIWVALEGKAAAPARPIRDGEEECRIVLDIGEYVIHRKFTDKGEGKITDTIKLLDDRGRIVPSPQRVLDDLLGAIGFDPFAFTKLKADDQADQLLQLVPLPIDLEDFAREDAADFATRRDRKRDQDALDARIAGTPQYEIPDDAPDRDALADQMANAADTNSAIDRERFRREGMAQTVVVRRNTAQQDRDRAQEIRDEIERLTAAAKKKDQDAVDMDALVAEAEAEIAALPALGEPVDTAALRQQLVDADVIATQVASNTRRAALVEQRDKLAAEVAAFTAAMADRETQRRDALGKARMPVEGLGFAVNEKGKPVVTWQGLPFAQASTAAQIRASTAIAMAANPDLRILRIKDGSLLDAKMMQIIVDMAEEDDWQLWIEVVGEGSAGIIIENGAVRGAPEPEAPLAAAETKGAKKAPTANAAKSKKPDAGSLL